MSNSQASLLQFIGYALLLLAGSSGVVLFFKATFSGGQKDNSSHSTLWGLFIVGLIAGLVLALSGSQR